MNPEAKIFINGCSSWIGHYVIQDISRRYPKAEIVGTYRSGLPHSTLLRFRYCRIESNADCIDLVREHKSDVFLNLARGEAEGDFAAHQKLIDVLNGQSGRYAFASTFNACDANLTSFHHEEEVGNAQSDYGRFKARCEDALTKESQSFAIFRFSATHGWAPNRCARTEMFLKQLQAGETVQVHRGIIQNRLFVGDLAGMMVDVSVSSENGVFHLGTTDFSEEVDFLRSLAARFGYSKDLVIESENSPTNAVMVPRKIFSLAGEQWRRTESQTIESVAISKELAGYRRS